MDTAFVGNAAWSVPMVIIVAGPQHPSCFYDVCTLVLNIENVVSKLHRRSLCTEQLSVVRDCIYCHSGGFYFAY